MLSADNLCKQSGSKLFDTLMVSMKEFFSKVDFEQIQQTTKSMKNYTVGKDLRVVLWELKALQILTYRIKIQRP